MGWYTKVDASGRKTKWHRSRFHDQECRSQRMLKDIKRVDAEERQAPGYTRPGGAPVEALGSMDGDER